MELQAVTSRLTNLKPMLHDKFGVSELGVFGSVVRGENRPDSDLDILVDFDDSVEIGLFEIMDLKELLENEFHTEVDIAVKSMLREYIGKYILKEVIYA